MGFRRLDRSVWLRSMTRSVRMLIVGFAVAGCVLATAATNTYRLRRDADKAQARCALLLARVEAGQSTGDPEMDAALTQPSPHQRSYTMDEMQRMVTPTGRCVEKLGAPDAMAISNSVTWPRLAAAVIGILGALPWTWYFLLPRIAAVRAASTGNPPPG